MLFAAGIYPPVSSPEGFPNTEMESAEWEERSPAELGQLLQGLHPQWEWYPGGEGRKRDCGIVELWGAVGELLTQ